MASEHIEFDRCDKTMESLCKQIKNALDTTIPDSEKTFIIPDHQRHAGVWPIRRREQLITSVRKNHPIPSILMGSLKREKLSLEDGLQRLSTFLDFYENKTTDAEGRYFKDYTPNEQVRFCTYRICVETYYNADQADRIEIFDNRQNGSPLTSGERLYAHSATPLVSYTIKMLLTPHKGLYGRFTNVWGIRGGDDDKKHRRKDLHQAVALVAGIAHGPDKLTKNYDVLRQHLVREFDTSATTRALERILEIYEQVQIKCRCGLSWIKKQFDVGHISGYIVYSMYHASLPNHRMADDDEWEPSKEKWIRYMTSLRTSSEMRVKNMKYILEQSLHRDVSASRNWTLDRWRKGYFRVFDADNELLQYSSERSDDEDDDEALSTMSDNGDE